MQKGKNKCKKLYEECGVMRGGGRNNFQTERSEEYWFVDRYLYSMYICPDKMDKKKGENRKGKGVEDTARGQKGN